MEILIVDDSRTFRFVLIKTLNELGHKSITAVASVDEAKTALEKHPFDVVLSDWHMPVETGLDLLKHIRATPALAKTPFIMVTTENDKSLIIEAAKIGMQGFLFKPVQKAVLAQKLTELTPASKAEPA